MQELDKNKIYDLSELTSEELQEVFTWLKNNDEDWHVLTFKNFKEGLDYARLAYVDNGWIWVYQEPTANAKELFYTLENIQVDCRNLTEEQIKEMADVFEKNGFDVDLDGITDEHFYLRLAKCGGSVDLFRLDDTKTTITYDKLMELFGEVVIEHTKEFIPSKKQVLKYLLERDIVLTPKQYKKLWKKS